MVRHDAHIIISACDYHVCLRLTDLADTSGNIIIQAPLASSSIYTTTLAYSTRVRRTFEAATYWILTHSVRPLSVKLGQCMYRLPSPALLISTGKQMFRDRSARVINPFFLVVVPLCRNVKGLGIYFLVSPSTCCGRCCSCSKPTFQISSTLDPPRSAAFCTPTSKARQSSRRASHRGAWYFTRGRNGSFIWTVCAHASRSA